MHARRFRSTLGFSSFVVLTVVLSGCNSAELIATKDREINDLEYEKGHLKESLAQAVSDLREVRSQLATAENERTKVVEEAEGLRTRLRFANEQLEVAAGERRKLETRAVDAEARGEMLERTLKKVQSVASDSVGELADLRFKTASYEQELSKLRDEARSLREDRAQLLDKVDGLQDEVTKSKIALRSLRSGQSRDKDAVVDLEQTIAVLEKENADLKGERIAFEKRINALTDSEKQARLALAKTEKTAADSEGSGNVAVASLSSIYTDDPQGLLREIGSFVRARYEKATLGEIEWDTVDQAIAGAAGLFLLFLLWTFLRSWRIRRLRRQVADLRDELLELEEAEARREQEERPQREQRGAGRVTRPTLRRSGGFSAVISSAGMPRPEAVATSSPRDAEEDELEDEPTMLVDTPIGGSALNVAGAGAAGADAPGGGGSSRRVIGARTWDDDEGGLDHDEDELASTQIIPSMSSSELEGENLIGNPGAVAGAMGTTGASPKKSSRGDQDLLDELKDAIHKKFDELV